MKKSQKNKKMAKFVKIILDICKISILSSLISLSVTSILLLINSFTGVFIGFRYYIVLALGMIMTLTPCWVLCDCKRIFSKRMVKSRNQVKVTRRQQKDKDTIRRRKIS